MSQEERISRMAVLLFTDMVGSVALERRLGTEAYSRLLKEHDGLFRQALAETAAGKVHLETGDGFLAEFATAADAVKVALLFQLFLRKHKWKTYSPKVRIGLHQGQLSEVRRDSASPGRVVGIPVSIASRVMGLAQAGQILMTRSVYDDARQFVREHPVAGEFGAAQYPLQWKFHGRYLFKGDDAPIEIFEVGASGIAAFRAPPDSEKGQRITVGEEERPAFRRQGIGVGLTILCGVALLTMPLGEPWINASYDYLFRFGARTPTNKVALILMESADYETLGQTRGSWNRSLHADLLNKLTEGGSPLVVFDILFRTNRNEATDSALAEAMRRHGHVVLMSELVNPSHPVFDVAQVILPDKLFIGAAASRGIGQADRGEIARQHRPFPTPVEEQFQSLPWAAARLAGGRLNEKPEEQWLRYYGEKGAWETFSYAFALSNGPAHFRGKSVFIGNKPESGDPSRFEEDKFRTPYTRWGGEAVGGVEIMATTFLNLMNGDWLRRASWPVEVIVLILIGGLAGGGLCRFNRLAASGLALGLALIVSLCGVLLSYFTNFWFPWLLIVGAQIPFALAWAIIPRKVRVGSGTTESPPAPSQLPLLTGKDSAPPSGAAVEAAPAELLAVALSHRDLPDAPEYELFDPPFGEGSFGKVWLARNAIGQWQALKAVYQSKFGDNVLPYEAEFSGLQKYKPISEKHPGLLRIDLISRKKDEGYFYYVMELGDALIPGWEHNPGLYKPRDLQALRKPSEHHRLPVAECVRIGVSLAETLDFLHGQGLTHRDIKPSNIIFVGGRPKLADVGLVTNIRPLDQIKTWVGTAGYMPPPPEHPGTAQADIYALGMVLYVISTGRDPDLFPDLATTLMEGSGHAEFAGLNTILLKACHCDCACRYQTAAEMLRDLQQTSRTT